MRNTSLGEKKERMIRDTDRSSGWKLTKQGEEGMSRKLSQVIIDVCRRQKLARVFLKRAS